VKIEALLFDLGKVVLDFNFELGMERLVGKCGLPPEEFKKAAIFAAKTYLPPIRQRHCNPTPVSIRYTKRKPPRASSRWFGS